MQVRRCLAQEGGFVSIRPDAIGALSSIKTSNALKRIQRREAAIGAPRQSAGEHGESVISVPTGRHGKAVTPGQKLSPCAPVMKRSDGEIPKLGSNGAKVFFVVDLRAICERLKIGRRLVRIENGRQCAGRLGLQRRHGSIVAGDELRRSGFAFQARAALPRIEIRDCGAVSQAFADAVHALQLNAHLSGPSSCRTDLTTNSPLLCSRTQLGLHLPA